LNLFSITDVNNAVEASAPEVVEDYWVKGVDHHHYHQRRVVESYLDDHRHLLVGVVLDEEEGGVHLDGSVEEGQQHQVVAE